MKYKLLKKCSANINSRSIAGDPGDMVELNSYEANVLSRGCYIEAVEQEITSNIESQIFDAASKSYDYVEDDGVVKKKRGRKKKDS